MHCTSSRSGAAVDLRAARPVRTVAGGLVYACLGRGRMGWMECWGVDVCGVGRDVERGVWMRGER